VYFSFFSRANNSVPSQPVRSPKPGENLQHQVSGARSRRSTIESCTASSNAHRQNSEYCTAHRDRLTSRQTFANASDGTVEVVIKWKAPECPACSNQIHKRNSPVLGVERMGGETVDPPLLSHSRDSHRCISPGLGWPHCNTSLPGPMVYGGKKLAHQCARADCCSTHSRTGSGGACARNARQDLDGQHDVPSVHKQRGRHTLSSTLQRRAESLEVLPIQANKYVYGLIFIDSSYIYFMFLCA